MGRSPLTRYCAKAPHQSVVENEADVTNTYFVRNWIRCIGGGVAGAGQATTVNMTARLTAKQAATLQSVKVTKASGHFTGTLLRHSNGRSKLNWSLRYRHMSSRCDQG